MTMIIIIACLGIVLLEIVVLMISNKKNKEMYKYIRAATSIARDMQLEQMLKNPYDPAVQNEPELDLINYICLTQINSQIKHEYVYSLNEPVRIGRAKNGNSLILSDPVVSEYHCMIYMENGAMVFRDNNSANGTVLQIGHFKKYLINEGGTAALSDENKLIFGSMIFKVRFIRLTDMI